MYSHDSPEMFSSPGVQSFAFVSEMVQFMFGWEYTVSRDWTFGAPVGQYLQLSNTVRRRLLVLHLTTVLFFAICTCLHADSLSDTGLMSAADTSPNTTSLSTNSWPLLVSHLQSGRLCLSAEHREIQSPTN